MLCAMDHETFMRAALEQARKAAKAGEVPVGCVVVMNQRIIAAAHNMTQSLNDPTAHAEILALRQASQNIGDWRLDGSIVYTTLEPCVMCSGALVMSRVKKLVYALEDEKFGGSVSLFEIPEDPRLNHRVQVIKGPLGEESAKLLKEFFKKRRRGWVL